MRRMNMKVYDGRKEKMMINDQIEKKMDKISDLPMEVIDAILIRLPLKDAVRTSILSRQWKQKWLTISQLVFDYDLILSVASKYERFSELMLVNTVDQILYRHQGSLRKFELLLDFNFECTFVIDRWMLYLSTIKGIKEIILWVDDHTKVLNGIYSFKELNHLELQGCTLELPSTFEGFPNLKSLVLYSVNFYKDDFSILVDKCPLIERLKFKPEVRNVCVSIDAPKLQFLSIRGYLSAFLLQNTPLVHTASISLCKFAGGYKPYHNCNLFEGLWRLPNLRTLKLKADTLMFSALKLKSIPKRFTATFYSLKSLEIEIDFENAREIFAALSLLRSSPNLCKLKIGDCDFREHEKVPVSPTKYWEADDDLDCLLNNLVKVRVSVLGTFGSELEFIKVVLANSPKLQKMTIKQIYIPSGHLFAREMPKYLKELILQFKRASPDAEILCI